MRGFNGVQRQALQIMHGPDDSRLRGALLLPVRRHQHPGACSDQGSLQGREEVLGDREKGREIEEKVQENRD